MASVCCLWLLSTSLVILAGLLTRLAPQHGPPHINYDGSVYFSHAHLKTPSSKDDIITIVRTAAARGEKVRVLGSGHSWSTVAVSEDVLVSLWNYTGIIYIDENTMEVTVKAGTTLKQLNRYLEDHGLAMKNLGSISDQSVAGAVSTGTHGNGLGFGNLATLVTRLEFVNGKGELVSASPENNPGVFKATQVSVGMLGIITEVTFRIEESYLLREIRTRHTLDHCLLNFDDLMRSGEHAKMWIEMFTGQCALFVSNKTTETRPRDNPNWSAWNIKIYALEAVLFVSSWFPFSIPHVMKFIYTSAPVFLPYDRVDVSYNVLQVPHKLPLHWEGEVVLPVVGCAEAIRELRRVVKEYAVPVNMPVEVRLVKADDIWLSPNYNRDSCHVTLTLYNPSPNAAHNYFGQFFNTSSRKLELAPRLHWGKYMSGVGSLEVESMYPRLPDFAKVRQEMDPYGLFINHALREKFDF